MPVYRAGLNKWLKAKIMNTKIQVTDNKFYMIKLLTIFHQRCDAGDKRRGKEAKTHTDIGCGGITIQPKIIQIPPRLK